MDQCLARCWRIGQQKDVVVHIRVTVFPNSKIKTFDEVLQKFLEIKRLRADSVLMPCQSYEIAANELIEEILRHFDFTRKMMLFGLSKVGSRHLGKLEPLI